MPDTDRLANDAEWLRTVCETAEVIPSHGDDIQVTYTQELSNQWLWPETRDNLIAIAAKLDALRAMPTPAGEDAPSDAEVEAGVEGYDDAAVGYNGQGRFAAHKRCIAAALTAAYKVRQQALSATPGPASPQEPTQAEIEAFFAIYSADVRYEAADHPRMLWLIGRALKSFVANRNLREPASREETK